MPAIDAQALRKKTPRDRMKDIQALRKQLADEQKSFEENARKQHALLDQLEKEARQELTTVEAVKVPEVREIPVERIFRKSKLEETVEEAPRVRQERDYHPPDPVKAVYSFREQHGYERLASIRDKVAAGETLTPTEQQTVMRYDKLVHEFERVSSKIQDEKARAAMTRAERAIHQIEAYKTRKHDDDEPQKRQDF